MLHLTEYYIFIIPIDIEKIPKIVTIDIVTTLKYSLHRFHRISTQSHRNSCLLLMFRGGASIIICLQCNVFA